MKIHGRKFEANISTERGGKVSDRVSDSAPWTGFIDVVCWLQVLVVWIEVSSFRWEDDVWVHEFAAEYECSSPNLRHSVIRCDELGRPDLELHLLFGSLQDFFILTGFEQLGHVFHQEDIGPRRLHNFKEGPPKLLARIILPILIEQTEALAGRAPDHHVRLRDSIRRIFQKRPDVAD
jgi:hypothetical protein